MSRSATVPRRGRAVFLAAALFLAVPAAVLGGVVYVVDAAAGRDDNPGTADQPWRTLAKAAEAAAPGDRVAVKAGVYDERVVLVRSGTPAAPIVFEAEGRVRTRGFSVRADDVVIRGFECESAGQRHDFDAAGIAVAGRRVAIEGNLLVRTAFYGILLDPASRDCRVAGNHCLQTAMAGIMVQGSGHLVEGNEVEDTRMVMAGNTYNDADGIRVFGSGHVLRGNYIHDITLEANRGFDPHIDGFQNWYVQGAAPLADCVFERNLIVLPIATATTHATGFMLDGTPTRVRIQNNLVRAGRGIHVIRGQDSRVLNNTVAGRLSWSTADSPAGILLENCAGMTVRSNIVYDFPALAIYTSRVSSLVMGYNCAYRSDGAAPKGSPQPADLWGRDPRFVSPESGDYRLRPDSPCIDAGSADAGVRDDFLGAPRPYGRGPDIGCYEFRPDFAPMALFTARPRSGPIPLRVAFDATPSYDPDGWIAALAWDFGDGAGGGEWRMEHTYERPGIYIVTLLVRDNDGLEGRMTDSIRTIAAGEGRGGLVAKPGRGKVPLEVTVDATAALAGPAPLGAAVFWDFGDGATATGVTASHAYDRPGVYTITLIIRTAGGGGRVLTARVRVPFGEPAERPPAGPAPSTEELEEPAAAG